jgi:hypothetical protein
LLLYELSIYLVKRAEAARPKSEYDDDDDEDEAGSEVEKTAS